MSLCSACVQLAKDLSELIAVGSGQAFSGSRVRHGRPFNELRYSETNNCPLCWLLQSNYVREDENEPLDDTFAAEILPSWVPDEASVPGATSVDLKPGPRRLRLLYVTVRRQGLEQGKLEQQLLRIDRPPVPLQVYAPVESKGTLRTNVWCGYRLPQSSYVEALSQCQVWLKTCLDGHSACYHRDSQGQRDKKDNPLPTRVIDCTPSNGYGGVCLVESDGLHGSWVALSHCWGSQEKRPLTTTRGNIGKHLEGLELSSLPKTFQDVIILTRSLGIRYLWIDSLCIVQDDPEDWKRESAVMGAIYECATITVAAAHAKDSSEGCFIDDAHLSYRSVEKPPESQLDDCPDESDGVDEILTCKGSPEVARAVTLPFFEEDRIMGSFSIAPWAKEQPPDSRVLNDLPLFKRGWVMQEWALSRRTLIFLKDSLIWSCRTLCVNESGKLLSQHVKRPSLLSWESLVEKYTAMDLTYESDRLVAIQGLANLIQIQRGDQYFAGMWAADLPGSLLWKVRDGGVGKLALQRSHLPSWTWAHIEGHVGFQFGGPPLKGHYSNGVKQDSHQFLEDTLQEFVIQPSGALYVVGLMTHIEAGVLEFVARRDRTRRQYKSVFKTAFNGYSNCRQAGGSIYGEQMVVIPSDDSSSNAAHKYQHHELAGWATLDIDTIPEPGSVYCLAVRREIDAVTRQGWVNGQPSFIEGDGYHVLVLRSVPSYGTLPRFVRIGIGVVQVSCRHWYLSKAEIV